MLGTPTTCRHCGTSFSPAGPVIIGQHPAMRSANFVASLAQHLHGAHQQLLAEAVIAGETLKGLLIVEHFHCLDPEILGAMDGARRQIQSLVRKSRVTDEQIDERVRAWLDHYQEYLSSYARAFEEISKLLRELRDQVTEQAPLDPVVSLAGRS